MLRNLPLPLTWGAGVRYFRKRGVCLVAWICHNLCFMSPWGAASERSCRRAPIDRNALMDLYRIYGADVGRHPSRALRVQMQAPITWSILTLCVNWLPEALPRWIPVVVRCFYREKLPFLSLWEWVCHERSIFLKFDWAPINANLGGIPTQHKQYFTAFSGKGAKTWNYVFWPMRFPDSRFQIGRSTKEPWF